MGRRVDADFRHPVHILRAGFFVARQRSLLHFGPRYSLSGKGKRLGPQTKKQITLVERYALPAAQIESRSFEVIEGLLPPDLSCTREERQIIKRIVHTSGDPQLASQVRIHAAAVEAGLAAIRSGATIFTDVQMAMAGVNRRLAEKFGCPVHCALATEGVIAAATCDGSTRATAAIRLLGPALDRSVVAIGNAPTALLALLDLVDQGVVRPALVVGVPVGFVGAAEAKQELLARTDIPSISIEGFRGGSTLATAIVNAMLLLA